MESNQTKVEWTHISGGGEMYNFDMQHAISGQSLLDSTRKLIANIPNLAVQCLKCGKIHPFANRLKACPNCSATNYMFGGSPAQVLIGCGRCGQEMLRSIKCDCGCINVSNGGTLRQPKTAVCFIATATYGSPFAPEVIAFRQFRVDYLLRSKLGALVVRLYYFSSPPIATVVANHRVIRSFTRSFLKCVLRLIKD